MTNRIINDISDFIFVFDEPQKVDAIFLPGGSHPQQPEYAAKLYRDGYAKWLVPSGGISVKRDKCSGVRIGAEKYDGDYQSDGGALKYGYFIQAGDVRTLVGTVYANSPY